MTTNRVIVTRPAREAAHWVEQLAARGHAATALPLIAIGACTDPGARAAIARARAQLDSYRAAMFVSGNAVDYFFEQKEPLALTEPAPSAIKTRAWAPGPGTLRALLRAGVPLDCIDSPAPDATQFDSESLWQQVATQVRAGDRILIVRGCSEGAEPGPGIGRDWLARQIEQAGATVEFVVAYTRGVRRASPPNRPRWPMQRQATVRGGCSAARKRLRTWPAPHLAWHCTQRARWPRTHALHRQRVPPGLAACTNAGPHWMTWWPR